jgi:hypothetical protein
LDATGGSVLALTPVGLQDSGSGRDRYRILLFQLDDFSAGKASLGLGKLVLNPTRQFLLPFSWTTVYSSVIRTLAWPAIVLASMLEAADLLTPRDVGAPERIGAESWKIATFSRCSPVEDNSHGRIPHRLGGIARLRKDPSVRTLMSKLHDLALIPARQTGDCELTFAFLGFRLSDILMPAALFDGKSALSDIEVPELEPEDLGDPGPAEMHVSLMRR